MPALRACPCLCVLQADWDRNRLLRVSSDQINFDGAPFAELQANMQASALLLAAVSCMVKVKNIRRCIPNSVYLNALLQPWGDFGSLLFVVALLHKSWYPADVLRGASKQLMRL